MRSITKTAAILFAYFCDSTNRVIAFLLTPLAMLISCFGKMDWRTRKNNAIKESLKVGVHITPLLTWCLLTLSIMAFWGGILEKRIFFDDHTKVANGSIILLVITILPIVVWWIRNKDFISDVENNLHLGENHKTFWVVASLLFFLLQLAMPFVMLWFIAIL